MTESNSILKAEELIKDEDKNTQTLIEYEDAMKTDTIEVSIDFDEEIGTLNDEIFDHDSQNPFNENSVKAKDEEMQTIYVKEDGNICETEEVQEHQKSRVKSKNFPCSKCSKTFTKASHLKRHKLTHEDAKFACDVEGCDKRYIRQDHLSVHRMNSHAEPRPFTCTVPNCRKGFHREDFLKRHIESQHGENTKDTITCEICSKSFKSKKYLKSHMKSHENPKPVTCKFCSDIFSSRNELNDHIAKQHQDEKPYLCSECGLRFVRNDYLVIHMRRHLGIKPYTCRFCGKGFPRATDLNVHERYHTNEKTHLCNLCGKGKNHQNIELSPIYFQILDNFLQDSKELTIFLFI